MTHNYRIVVHFDGTDYSGWQCQKPETPTVQGKLVHVLKIIAKQKVMVTGSSRTDAGVHATGLVANFHIKIRIEAESMKKALNSLLPKDIRIMDCRAVDSSFNARFDAQGKVYVYRLFFGQVCPPAICRFVTHIPYPLNRKRMRRSIKYFIGEKDFSSFTSDEPQKKRIRRVSRFKMKVKGEEIVFTINGKSFLRYMVRNMVGTIIDVGRGKIEPRDIPAIFAAKDRRKAGQTAPARGLTLAEVKYASGKGKKTGIKLWERIKRAISGHTG